MSQSLRGLETTEQTGPSQTRSPWQTKMNKSRHVKDCASWLDFVTYDGFEGLQNKTCCEQVVVDVIKTWHAQIVGELIFFCAHLCNGISVIDKDLHM